MVGGSSFAPPGRAEANAFRKTLQSSYDAVWAPQHTAKVGHAPALRVLAADPGVLPECARGEDSPVFFVHLSGHYRSFGATNNLRGFLEGSSNCWFVILYTLDFAEFNHGGSPWWCRYYKAANGDRARCAAGASRAANDSVTGERVEAARARLLRQGSWRQLQGDQLTRHQRAAPVQGGLAYAVVSRQREPDTHTAVLQNFAAVATLARAVLRHHGAGARPSDVILHSRPDILYSAPIAYQRLAHWSRASVSGGTPLLLLLRHGGNDGFGGVNWNDPSDVAWFASRQAYDRLCPAGAPCLHARTLADLRQRGGCGHPYVRLFVHATAPLGLGTFFIATGWRVALLRPHGDASRGYNGGNTSMLPPVPSDGIHSMLSPVARVDLTAGVRCATGHDELNQSACRTGPSHPNVAQTRWGRANLSAGFAYGARYFVCVGTLQQPSQVLGTGVVPAVMGHGSERDEARRRRRRVVVVSVAIGPKYEPRAAQMREAYRATAAVDELVVWARRHVQADPLYRQHVRTFEWMERTYRRQYHYRPYCALFKPLLLWRALQRAADGDVVIWADANKYHPPARLDSALIERAVSRLQHDGRCCAWGLAHCPPNPGRAPLRPRTSYVQRYEINLKLASNVTVAALAPLLASGDAEGLLLSPHVLNTNLLLTKSTEALSLVWEWLQLGLTHPEAFCHSSPQDQVVMSALLHNRSLPLVDPCCCGRCTHPDAACTNTSVTVDNGEKALSFFLETVANVRVSSTTPSRVGTTERAHARAWYEASSRLPRYHSWAELMRGPQDRSP